jgi:hypothetical protein
MKQLLLITIIAVWNPCAAQNNKSIPGFLGSRNAVSIKLQPNFAPGALIQQLLSPTIGVTYERALSRRGSISVSAGMGAGTYNEEAFFGFDDRGNEIYMLDQAAQEEHRVLGYTGWITYKNSYISLSKSYYMLQTGSIAPQGKSFKFGLTYNFFRITDEDMEYLVEDDNLSRIKNPDKDYKTLRLLSFNVEFGSKRFFSKHLFFSKSFALNIPGNFWSTSSGKTFNNIDDFQETHLAFFFSKVQTFNFSFGLGAAF